MRPHVGSHVAPRLLKRILAGSCEFSGLIWPIGPRGIKAPIFSQSATAGKGQLRRAEPPPKTGWLRLPASVSIRMAFIFCDV